MGKKIVSALAALLLLFFFDNTQALAQNINVTATVPVSDLWAEAIAQNSQILATFEGQELRLSVLVKGLDNETLKNHKVKMEVFSGDKLLTTITGNDEPVVFSFTPQKIGHYRFVFTDITWERAVKLKEFELSQPRIKIFKDLETFFC